jgi:predicted nucleotide-binding protein
VPSAIEDANVGKPYPPHETAIALNITPGCNDWRVLTSASLKYGLTIGSYKAERLEITPLGRLVVAPTSDEERTAALFKAALAPPVFKAIFEHYSGKKIPPTEFFANTVVRAFGVPKEHAPQCVEIFTTNAQFVGLTRTTSNGQWLSAEPSGLPTRSVDMRGEAEAGDGEVFADAPPKTPPTSSEPTTSSDGSQGQGIFVGHGKNRIPMQQLEKILNEYGIPHRVVMDEANEGRPISAKVAQAMRECGAAILIFTADEEFLSPSGDTIWRPSENVVYELGAAAVLYDKKIIIFKEVGVTLPTNFRDIGYISFEKDDLAAKGVELFRELIAAKLIEVSVPGT